MKIYQMRDAASRGFPYASSYGALDIPMPFLQGEVLERSREFWKINPKKPGLYITERGSKWGDFLMCGFSPPRTLISEHVLYNLRAINSVIISQTEFPVAQILSKKLRDVPPPRYFALQWAGGIAVDWRATGVEQDAAGKPIIIPGKTLTRVAQLSTWNGNDVFSWSNWDVTRLTMLCTERVMALAAKEKWTNVRFDPVPTS